MPDLIQQMREAGDAVRAKLPAGTPVAVNMFIDVTACEEVCPRFMIRIGDVTSDGQANYHGTTLAGVRDQALAGAPKWADKRTEDERAFRRLARELGHYLPPGGE